MVIGQFRTWIFQRQWASYGHNRLERNQVEITTVINSSYMVKKARLKIHSWSLGSLPPLPPCPLVTALLPLKCYGEETFTIFPYVALYRGENALVPCHFMKHTGLKMSLNLYMYDLGTERVKKFPRPTANTLSLIMNWSQGWLGRIR